MVAARLKFAAAAPEGLWSMVPSTADFAPTWQPSLLISTVMQLHEMAITKQQDHLVPDLCQRTLRRTEGVGARKWARQGPCLFGCQKTHLRAKERDKWRAALNPWRRLCSRCYVWARRAAKTNAMSVTRQSTLRPGQLVELHGLTRRTDLNEMSAFVDAVEEE